MSWYHYILGFIGLIVVANIFAFFSDLRGLFDEIKDLKRKVNALQFQTDCSQNSELLKKYCKYYGYTEYKFNSDKDSIILINNGEQIDALNNFKVIVDKVEEAKKLKKNICCKK